MNETFPFPTLALGGLGVELTALILVILLGVVQLGLAALAITAERGAKWNMGPRDAAMPPPGIAAGRLERAYRNLMETFPYFAAAILAAIISGRMGTATALGAEIYLIARILYVPLYAFAVTGVRSLVWTAGLLGLLLVIAGLFDPNVI